MSTILDSRDELQKNDPKLAIRSLEQLGSQVKQIWELTSALQLDASYSSIKNVVVAGMGGSAYGTHVITTVFKEQLSVPVTVVPDYTVPAYVGQDTLVIVSSYSGSSEETLAAAEDARTKGAKIIGLTSGGKLGAWLTEHSLPFIQFDGSFNPCGVARFGYGYSIFGQMAIFAKVGLITIKQSDVDAILAVIADAQLRCSADIPQDDNEAKLLAFELVQRAPVFTVAEHLEGIAHVVANAMNENAKTYSEYRSIPELNHHLLEGFKFPQTNEQHYLFLTTPSSRYAKSNQHRMELTQEVLEKHHIEWKELPVNGKSKLEEVFSYLIVGVYASYYLAALLQVDPAGTPEVEWFKKELAAKI